NLEKIILAILFVSMIPAFIAAWRGYRGRRRVTETADREPEKLPASE
ncbi:DedA family protein, partial [Mycobacterium kansasii]